MGRVTQGVVRHEFGHVGQADETSGTALVSDPILIVTGVGSSEILQRCQEIRHDGRRGLVHIGGGEAPGCFRLLDFADLPAEQFVQEAHRILLGREASQSDVARRVRELRGRSSRLEIVLRLALSPEGRHAIHPPVRGPGLRAVIAAAHAVEAAQGAPLIGDIVRTAEPAARALLFGRTGAVRIATRVVLGGAAGGAIVAVGRRHRRRVQGTGGKRLRSGSK